VQKLIHLPDELAGVLLSIAINSNQRISLTCRTSRQGSSRTMSRAPANRARQSALDGASRCGYQPRFGRAARAVNGNKGCFSVRGRSMYRLFLASICLTTLCVGSGFAEDPAPSASPESPASRESVAAKEDQPDQIVDHLLKAAHGFAMMPDVGPSAKTSSVKRKLSWNACRRKSTACAN
jgi:hypothetical protein